MLRITSWRISGGPPPTQVTPQQLVQTVNEVCATLSKLQDNTPVRWYFGNGGIVIIGEPKNYASADTILQSKVAQAAIARMFALGYGLQEDQFLLDPAQVLPFAQATTDITGAVPAQMSRN